MYLNTLSPAPGSKTKPKRLGRGIGSTLGKTCCKGHKGQKARAGGFHKVGFEGGQMPLQRRLPKIGFVSPTRDLYAEVRLNEIDKLQADVIDLKLLKLKSIVPAATKVAKVIKSGSLSKAVVLKGIKVTSGAKEVIESFGGRIED